MAPPGRFGGLALDGDTVEQFVEKPQGDNGQINGGFFVLEPAAIDYVTADETVWEREPMEQLARNGELSAFRHEGFWQPMDTLRDRQELERHWAEGTAPWKIWT